MTSKFDAAQLRQSLNEQEKAFIAKAGVEETTDVSTSTPLSDIPAKEKQESRSRRVSLTIRPSVYEQLKKTAEAGGHKVNDYINILIEKHLGIKEK